MYELLYTNIDVTSTVTSFLLLNISANQSFQSKLREEIQARQNEPSYKLMDYVEKKDTLLHYAVMESLRMSPALCKSL
jgi:cytochrome P450 monooxygenase